MMNPQLSRLSPPRLPLSLSRLLLGAMLALSLSSTAQAIAIMDIEPGDILPMVAQLKDDLHLNPNQQILWQQTAQRTRTLVRQRQVRREQLQAMSAEQVARPNMEFTDLAKAVAREAQLSEEENRQLRDLWLTVADALDDKQRAMAQSFIADRMQRISERSSSKSDSGGMGPKGGGMGGMGGGGMGGSSGMGGMGGSGSTSTSTGF
jgi:uncharacterized membrane protein YgcG